MPLIEQHNLGNHVVQPGHIAEEDLPALYSLADVLVFPSIIEGFGLPVLEAMACGTAVIASNNSSLPEIVGKAGLLVNPLKTKALADALLRVLKDQSYRHMLGALAQQQAAQFSWQQAAHLTYRIYQQTQQSQALPSPNPGLEQSQLRD